MKPIPIFIFLCLVFLLNGAATAQNHTPLPGLSAISELDIRNSAIAFVNTTSSRGLEGASLSVDNGQRNSDQFRSSLGFDAEVTLKDYIFNAYWGLGIVGGSLNDRIQLTGDSGQPVQLDLARDIISMRGSMGLSFPVNEHFNLRPVLTIAVSDVKTKFIVDGILDSNNNPTTVSFSNSAQMLSTTASLDALYWNWFDNYKLELSGHYNLIYTDSFSSDNPILTTTAWNQTAQLKFRFSGPTSMALSSRPWRWNVYANHTSFIDQNKAALGYTALFEFGTGLEWELNVKPLDWFGWQFIGINAGVITSSDIEGFNIGLTAR